MAQLTNAKKTDCSGPSNEIWRGFGAISYVDRALGMRPWIVFGKS